MTDFYTKTVTLLERCAESLTSTYGLPVSCQPEDQLKGPVASLVEGIGTLLGLTVQTVTEVRVQEVAGRPDMGVIVGGLLNGHIELKAPGKGADPKKFKDTQNKAQWEKFKNLPNLLYTDGNEWALYRNGERIGTLLRLPGDITEDGAAAIAGYVPEPFLAMFRDFLRWEPVVPSSPKALAELLAPLCRLLRSDVKDALDNPASSLSALAVDWRQYLFPDADDWQFADAYAQTLTYALLLARLSGEAHVTPAGSPKTIRSGHRLLADALKILGDDTACAEIAAPLTLLERIIDAVDIAALGRKSKGDPWLYFYEDFLASYDPKMRRDRGVYYTPVEVVQAQVRLVAELLEERFNAEYSFADPKVITLDPAAGTGTYILAALSHALEKVAATKGPGMKATAASTAARNIHAFEILVGPYAVAHLRLTQMITAEHGTLPADGVHVYLTDTLESPYAPPRHYPTLYKSLGDEYTRAQKVKAETPVMVCIGNPPYDRQTIDGEHQGEKRKGGWVRSVTDKNGKEVTGILRDFLDPLEPLGQGVHAKNLYNDYVYFWRWALWKVFEPKELTAGEKLPAVPGIVSFITASSYLLGPGFAGMRQVMRQTFDELWIIDLEGGSLGARKTENVFAIQTPVAIAIGIRNAEPQPETPALVRYTRIEGTSEGKLAQLAEIERFSSLQWRNCANGWTDIFLPAPEPPYALWPLLTDLFPWQANGVKLGRTWPIDVAEECLQLKWQTLLASTSRKELFKNSPTGRKVDGTAPALPPTTETAPSISKLPQGSPILNVQRYAFRSFDRQWLIADARVIDRPNPSLWQAIGPRQIFLTSMLTDIIGNGPSSVATSLLPDLHHFCNRGAKDIIPLWRDAAGTNANITPGVLPVLAAGHSREVSAEELFCYAYAVLATPLYVRRFWDELRTPGPRLPIAKDTDLFIRLATIGRELIWLHTYGERFIPEGWQPGRIPQGTARCKVGTPATAEAYPESFFYDGQKEELTVGTGVFEQVRSEVWKFSVSGLKVVESWLGYRMKKRSGKKSSPLDDIRPALWQFDDELLQLLWVLDATIDRLPALGALFEELLKTEHFTATDFPTPSGAERQGPKTRGAAVEQSTFGF